jgi:hypothetical protein
MNDSPRPDAARRHLLLAAAAAAMPFAARPAFAAETEKLRIGFQKSSTLTILLKSRGTLETALAPLKIDVQWHEFTSGLPLLEALNIGAVDLSADVADAVPPFALAAGAKLTYYAIETPSPQAQAIVVRKDSALTSVAQLRGQKVAFAKGAGAHYLILEALAQSGLTIKDIEPAYLTPADGRAAFEGGNVAAWVIWDPFLAAVQRQSGARVLLDGSKITSKCGSAALLEPPRGGGPGLPGPGGALELPPLLPCRHALRATSRRRARRGVHRTAARRRMDQEEPRRGGRMERAGDRAGRRHRGGREPAPQLPRAAGRRRGAGRAAAHRRRVHAGADPAEARQRRRRAGVAAGLSDAHLTTRSACCRCGTAASTTHGGPRSRHEQLRIHSLA